MSRPHRKTGRFQELRRLSRWQNLVGVQACPRCIFGGPSRAQSPQTIFCNHASTRPFRTIQVYTSWWSCLLILVTYSYPATSYLLAETSCNHLHSIHCANVRVLSMAARVLVSSSLAPMLEHAWLGSNSKGHACHSTHLLWS